MILDALKKDIPFVPYMNTNTMFDLVTGKFRPGINNTWILDAGISPCTSITGRGQTFKSGLIGSLLANSMLVYPNSYAVVCESENNIPGPERYDDFVPMNTPVSNRIVFKPATLFNLTEGYEEFVELAEERIKHKKDYIVESPFINPSTGKPYRIWIPIFWLIDSFSRARAQKSEQIMTDVAVDDSAQNQSWMIDGNIKSKIMNDMPTRAARSGIYVMLTAHVGDKIDMNGPTPKQLQYMKQSDRIKNVGSSFEFLTTTLMQTLNATVLQDKDKKCVYGTKYSTDVELSKVKTMMVRSKNNASGLSVEYIVSQYQGILNAITDLHFLRTENNYGLNVKGNNQSFATMLSPDISFTRNNIREMTDNDYQLCRALQLLTQLCFIQKYWSTWRMPDYIHMKPEEFAELMDKSGSAVRDRILNSTGVWSTAKQERERLTIMDILAFLDANKHIKSSSKVT